MLNDTFHQELYDECMGDLVNQWRIGPGGIRRKDVIVIGAINVSVVSWMPILQLNRYVF